MELHRVLVLNHFAKPTTEPGGNRHVDLFARLDGWHTRILAADFNPMSGRRQGGRATDEILEFVPTISGRGTVRRIAGWISYAVSAIVVGVRGPRPDVVYASSPHLLAGVAGYVLSKRWRVPWVLEVRDIWPRILVEMGGMSPDSAVYKQLRRVERFLYRRANHVVCLAKGNIDYVVSEGTHPDRVTYIPNSVAPTHRAISREASRERFGFRGATFVYTGAHGKANALDYVLKLAQELGDESGINFHLFGDGTEKQRLMDDAHRSGLQNVKFHDPLPKRELPDVFVGGDFGLHVLADVPLFRHGVSPNKIMDYMAAGLPVVSNSPGEAGDVILQARAGLVCEPTELMTGVREAVLLDSEARAAMGRNGRQFIESERNPDLMSTELGGVLTEVLRFHTLSGERRT